MVISHYPHPKCRTAMKQKEIRCKNFTKISTLLPLIRGCSRHKSWPSLHVIWRPCLVMPVSFSPIHPEWILLTAVQTTIPAWEVKLISGRQVLRVNKSILYSKCYWINYTVVDILYFNCYLYTILQLLKGSGNNMTTVYTFIINCNGNTLKLKQRKKNEF